MAILIIKLQCRKEGMCTHRPLHVLRAFMPGLTSLSSLFSLNDPEIHFNGIRQEERVCYAELSCMMIMEPEVILV